MAYSINMAPLQRPDGLIECSYAAGQADRQAIRDEKEQFMECMRRRNRPGYEKIMDNTLSGRRGPLIAGGTPDGMF